MSEEIRDSLEAEWRADAIRDNLPARKAEFTPRPWTVEQDNFGDGDGDQWTVAGGPKSDLIACIYSTEDENVKAGNNLSARSEADAHLIAAAPDLYEALEKCASVMGWAGDHDFDDKTYNDLAVPAIEACDAALAKARGEA